MEKTRAVYAMEALKERMELDNEQNIGLHEAYRMGLEDMVAYIDFPDDASSHVHPALS